MKKILLLGLGIVMTGVINAQVVFSGVSPAAIEGNYDMEYGDPGSNWGGPDLMDPLNAIEDTLVAYLTDTLACASATNPADLFGQIAVVYRGDCEFGAKTAMAEAAGAIACVIINNIPGAPVPMAGGAAGPGLNIPGIMIGEAEGALLMDEMKNGEVVVFIGNKQGYFANDIGLRKEAVMRPKYSSIPSALATNGTEYPVELSGKIFNYGSSDITNVALQAIITYNGAEVYNEIATAVDITSGDSSEFTLPNYAPASWDEGYYSLTYTAISDAIDESDVDNTMESDFVISPSNLAYASIVDTSLITNSTGGTRPVDVNGEPIPYFSSCIHFQDPNASRLAPRSLTFTALKGSDADLPTMEGEEVRLQVFEYNDVFADITETGYTNPIGNYSELMAKDYSYPSDLSDTAVTVNFDNSTIVALEDNQRYMFCVTTYLGDIYFGTDSKRDYTLNQDNYLQPLFPIEAPSGTFNPNGFGPTTVPSLMASFIDASEVSLKEEKLAINMNAYPSPASDVLNVDFNQNEVNKVELVNMMGQTVAVQNVTNNAKKVEMNVASIENGVYIVKVYLTNNMTHTMQVVVNH